METYTIPRDGDAPITFDGELLAEEAGRQEAGKERNRWFELAVYRTADGQIVGQVRYRTQWQGEVDRDEVEVAGTPAEIVAWFRGYNPAERVQGYPPTEAYADRQARLLAELTAIYSARLGRLLSAAGDDFAERLDSDPRERAIARIKELSEEFDIGMTDLL